MINQIEYHPYAYSTLTELLSLCAEHQISVQPVSALVPIRFKPDGPATEILTRISEERGRGEGKEDILMIWAKQVSGGTVITSATDSCIYHLVEVALMKYSTSSKVEHMKHSLDLFRVDVPALTDDQVALINAAGAKAPLRQWTAMWPYFVSSHIYRIEWGSLRLDLIRWVVDERRGRERLLRS